MTTTRRTVLAGGAAAASLLLLPLAAHAEGTLEAAKKRGTFRVGVTQAPPWFSKDPKTGEWSSGLGISMGKAMAQTLGVKMETVEVSWGNSIAALQGDMIDIMFTIDATPERKQAVDFPTSPLLAARQKLGKGKIVVPMPVQSQASSAAVRKGDTEFVTWVDKQLAAYYQSGQTQKWYEQALSDFGLDPKLAPPIMKEMIK